MSNPIKPTEATVSIPKDFEYGEVVEAPKKSGTPPPSLGPLAAFVGNWIGSGFNTIFRPNNPKTPTVLPVPVPGPVSDNILELNLTSESLSFSASLGSVPNRGTDPQADIFLNGVPYLQTVNDVTTPGQTTGIHVEPGLWMVVPSTTNPAEGPTLVRMGSIPHGTTIQAQGTATVINGPPNIPSVNITPFATPPTGIPANPPTVPPVSPVKFISQTATNNVTPRIPQDLTAFISAGTITQAILDDPNTVLRDHIKLQKITSTTQISISTQPASPPPIAGCPLFGGGADNIAFLLGDKGVPVPARPNAQTLQMTATFWIEIVEHTIMVPAFRPGQPALAIKGEAHVLGQHAPVFSVIPPFEITEPRPITVKTTQIQYSQLVLLNFNGLTWPHVSVATLVPSGPVPVPPSAWD